MSAVPWYACIGTGRAVGPAGCACGRKAEPGRGGRADAALPRLQAVTAAAAAARRRRRWPAHAWCGIVLCDGDCGRGRCGSGGLRSGHGRAHNFVHAFEMCAPPARMAQDFRINTFMMAVAKAKTQRSRPLLKRRQVCTFAGNEQKCATDLGLSACGYSEL